MCDTINSTPLARLALVTVAERLPGGPPLGCHDPRLFVAPARLRELCAAGGVELHLRGLRPHVRQYLRFLRDRRRSVRMLPTRSLAAVYQGWGKRTA